jgi:hypothetical protein
MAEEAGRDPQSSEILPVLDRWAMLIRRRVTRQS